jgi:hypothetical protein
MNSPAGTQCPELFTSFKLSPLLPLGAVLLTVSLQAQEVDPPPLFPGEPTESSLRRVNIPPAPGPRPANTTREPGSPPAPNRVGSRAITQMNEQPSFSTPRPRQGKWPKIEWVLPNQVKSATIGSPLTMQGQLESIEKQRRAPVPSNILSERLEEMPEPAREMARATRIRPKATSALKFTPEREATPEPRQLKLPKSKLALKSIPSPRVTAELRSLNTTTPTYKSTVLPPMIETADAEEAERNKFAEVKQKAAEDPEILKLAEKAESAASEDEVRQALRAYNKALFQKMRKLDSSIKERTDATEAVIMQRLGGE